MWLLRSFGLWRTLGAIRGRMEPPLGALHGRLNSTCCRCVGVEALSSRRPPRTHFSGKNRGGFTSPSTHPVKKRRRGKARGPRRRGALPCEDEESAAAQDSQGRARTGDVAVVCEGQGAAGCRGDVSTCQDWRRGRGSRGGAAQLSVGFLHQHGLAPSSWLCPTPAAHMPRSDPS